MTVVNGMGKEKVAIMFGTQLSTTNFHERHSSMRLLISDNSISGVSTLVIV